MSQQYLDKAKPCIQKHSEIINALRHINAFDIKSLSMHVSSSWPTVKAAVEDLKESNIILSNDDEKKYLINPEVGYFLGIAIGATETKLSIIDFTFKPVDLYKDTRFKKLIDLILSCYPAKEKKDCLCFDTKLDYSEIYTFCTQIIEFFLDFFSNEETDLNLISIGISLPGIIDKNTKEMTFCPNIPSLVGLPIDKIISSETKEKLAFLKIPFNVYRDAIAATVGEKEMLYNFSETKKIYKDKQNLAVIYLGYGMGSGYIFNNRLILGASGAVGEIGHIDVGVDIKALADKRQDESYLDSAETNIVEKDDENGCACQNKFCLEHLIRTFVFNSDSPNNYKTKTEIEGLKNFSKSCPHRYKILTELLSKAINTIVNMLNVDLIVLSGRILNGIPELRSDLEKMMNMVSLKASSKYCNIVNGSERLDIVAIGAAILSYYSFLDINEENQDLKIDWNTNIQ